MRGALTDHSLHQGPRNTIDLVVPDVDLNPLYPRSRLSQHAARFLRDRLQLQRRQLARSSNVSFNDELRHRDTPVFLNRAVRFSPTFEVAAQV